MEKNWELMQWSPESWMDDKKKKKKRMIEKPDNVQKCEGDESWKRWA